MTRLLHATLFAASLVASLPSAALAADDEFPDTPENKGTETKTEPVKPVEAKAETKADEKAPAVAEKPKFKGPFARIADEEETIYAVQRKAFLVKSKLEITPMAAASFTDRFVQTFGFGGSLTYHLAENFGIEAFGMYMLPDPSGLTSEILRQYKLRPEVAKLTQMLWASGLGVQWSPIYGKLQILGSSLGNFSFYVGAGIGVGQTRVQCTSSSPLDPERGFDPSVCPMQESTDPGNPDAAYDDPYEPARMQLMGTLSGGFRFHFSNHIGLKFEVKDWAFSTRVFRPGQGGELVTVRYTDAIRNNIFAQLGLSILLGGEE